MVDQNTVHGDIRACNIFITEDGKRTFLNFSKFLTSKGCAKFSDSNLVDYRQDAYTKTLLRIAKCPIPPELLTQVKKRETKYKHNVESSESWMIGVLLLCCATLVPEDAFYDWIGY